MDIDMDMLRQDFPVMKKFAYMNNASYTPVPLYSIKAMADYMVETSLYGPDSPTAIDDLKTKTKEARQEVAGVLNCNEDELIFTQSTTEGLNYVANGISFKRGDGIIIRDGDHEHPANYIPWIRLRNKGVKINKLKIDENGYFDIDEFAEMLERDKGHKIKLAVLSHALFNTGSILPVEKIGRMIKKKRKDVLFCLDAAQTVGCLPVDVNKIECDFLAFPGSKWLCGPLGTGVFYCSKDAAAKLEPSHIGGESAFVLEKEKITYKEMPHRMQAGYRNWMGMVGLMFSVRFTRRLDIGNIRRKNMDLANALREGLDSSKSIRIYGPGEEKLRTSIVPFEHTNVEAEEIVEKLESNGIIFAKRDISGKKVVRASPHFFNQEGEIHRAVEIIKKLQ